MAEQVLPLDLGVTWEPNAPDAVLLTGDHGQACLALQPYPSDSDERAVVLRWVGCRAACMGPPNDEARHEHRLYDHGLAKVLWAAEVENSRWVEDVAGSFETSPLRHFLIVLKENVVEAVAEGLQVLRLPGPPPHAALAALELNST